MEMEMVEKWKICLSSWKNDLEIGLEVSNIVFNADVDDEGDLLHPGAKTWNVSRKTFSSAHEIPFKLNLCSFLFLSSDFGYWL